MVDSQLLAILCCPETKQDLVLANTETIDKLNRLVEKGSLKNRGGEIVKDKMEAGLIRTDKLFLYPIRDDIPIMLIDEAIPMQSLI